MAVNDVKTSKQFIFYLNTHFPSIPVHLYSFGVKKKTFAGSVVSTLCRKNSTFASFMDINRF